jgi:hypothetical protein
VKGVTGPDGHVKLYHGYVAVGVHRLLGPKTLYVSFVPWAVQVDAPGYRRFSGLLGTGRAGDGYKDTIVLTDPPLRLVYPPPAVTEIRLAKVPDGRRVEGKTPL